MFQHAASDLGYEMGKTMKLECNDQDGYFFRVTLKEEPALRKNKSYKIINVFKGGVRFTNNKLSELSETYSETVENYEEVQQDFIKEIFDVAGYY